MGIDESIEIPHWRWAEVCKRIADHPQHGGKDNLPPEYYTFISGKDGISQYADIRCVKENCCGVVVTVFFPYEGAHILPMPVGFDFIRDTWDLEIDRGLDFVTAKDTTN
jgi:hypothetical protein